MSRKRRQNKVRPIELTVKGLHSFREKQMIDFQTLCAGGVFGIFGPTGSGKSSLLDAMTLALYGKVERAANNTHGIMNHAEDTLSVGFTFQLGYQGSARRYRAERSLKRTGEAALRTATCRFLDVTGDPVVLADKTGDVNRKVEDLLGLSSDDFTRAVVLPQGKFAEFLSLKGSERRHMLQRLFHLEKYGDELIRKLKDRLRLTEHEKGQVEAEQAGLGDASTQAVNEAKNRVKALENALQEAIQEQVAAEKRHQEENQLRHWQQEKAEAEQQLRELERDGIGGSQPA
jgi:DNA repair protein SbcC/Rad50